MVDQIVATPEGPRIVSRGPQSAAGKLFHVGFGLEAKGQYEEAWAAFSQANAMRAADPAEPLTPARYGEIQAEMIRIQKALFVKEALPTLVEEGPKLAPIFIVGMPIAGAPVIEELLGAHPKKGRPRTVPCSPGSGRRSPSSPGPRRPDAGCAIACADIRPSWGRR